MGRYLKRKSTRIRNKVKNFDVVLSGEQSWMSGNNTNIKATRKTNIEYQGMQNMWSGEYFIYTDVSYDMPIHELADLSKHMHPTGNK